MKLYIVTIKLKEKKEHNPRNKKIDYCPLTNNHICTDSTGAHHSVLIKAENINKIKQHLKHLNFHITRIEEVTRELEITSSKDYMQEVNK